jgi:hypothetical protein
MGSFHVAPNLAQGQSGIPSSSSRRAIDPYDPASSSNGPPPPKRLGFGFGSHWRSCVIAGHALHSRGLAQPENIGPLPSDLVNPRKILHDGSSQKILPVISVVWVVDVLPIIGFLHHGNNSSYGLSALEIRQFTQLDFGMARRIDLGFVHVHLRRCRLLHGGHNFVVS